MVRMRPSLRFMMNLPCLVGVYDHTQKERTDEGPSRRGEPGDRPRCAFKAISRNHFTVSLVCEPRLGVVASVT